MHTLDEIKSELVDHIYGIDKGKLSIYDLKTYVEMVKIMDEIERANKPDKWMELLGTMSTVGFGPQYKPVEMKEV